jgi:hypothetical protein
MRLLNYYKTKFLRWMQPTLEKIRDSRANKVLKNVFGVSSNQYFEYAEKEFGKFGKWAKEHDVSIRIFFRAATRAKPHFQFLHTFGNQFSLFNQKVSQFAGSPLKALRYDHDRIFGAFGYGNALDVHTGHEEIQFNTDDAKKGSIFEKMRKNGTLDNILQAQKGVKAVSKKEKMIDAVVNTEKVEVGSKSSGDMELMGMFGLMTVALAVASNYQNISKLKQGMAGAAAVLVPMFAVMAFSYFQNRNDRESNFPARDFSQAQNANRKSRPKREI